MKNNLTFTIQCHLCNAVEMVENVSKKGSDIAFTIKEDTLVLYCVRCNNDSKVRFV